MKLKIGGLFYEIESIYRGELCARVHDFYKSTFGGEVIPLNEHEGKLLHAELKLQEDVVLHLSDDYGKGTSNTGAQILLTFNNKETQQRIYDALSVKGDPHMPLNRIFLMRFTVK
ncbi:VOC family protein [Staphylococcus chromogenes]|uniref:VOC family protein n=1 Tax=Staphylococcus chromogenes TaxID=46126 RepID=UPI0021D29018|nr:VOC family protein [Staphylococcus chromogenes]UXS76092.1 VOC family protein [Staphylococcus chromogenes]